MSKYKDALAAKAADKKDPASYQLDNDSAVAAISIEISKLTLREAQLKQAEAATLTKVPFSVDSLFIVQAEAKEASARKAALAALLTEYFTD